MEGKSSKKEMENYSEKNQERLWDAYMEILSVFRDQFNFNIANLDAGDQDKFFKFIKEEREYWRSKEEEQDGRRQ